MYPTTRPPKYPAAWLLCLALCLAPVLQADEVEPQSPAQDASLNEQIQTIKQQTLELNRDLFILEEELLYPSDTQLSVFLSLDVGEFFKLDAVKLTLDGKVVTNYLYTDRQLSALRRGGVQRLYLGNVKSGEHEIVAVFTGFGPKGRDYRRGTELVIDKTTGPKHLELKIVDSTDTRQPDFVVKEW
ncbi:MAG: AraC family transcriptional regulator [Halieaceae bacterium]